jgi:oligopeptide/dipeptide ABC transporter ATP-binding protein
MAAPILKVEGLKTQFRLRAGVLTAVDGLSFTLEPGKVLCIVGESGSGKSVTAQSILRLVEPPGRVVEGRVLYRDQDLLALSERAMERIRGDRICMVFQDPMTSLNPVFAIGEQIAEGLRAHQGLDRAAARARAIELLRLVGIPNPEQRCDDYPHQFSGGMRQRALIAAAIACEPDILIADEPTTALDVTIQAQILKLLADLQKRLNSAMILITHDLGVVANLADQVLVMYAGRMAEYGDVEAVFGDPKHPYTIGLMNSIIRLEEPRDAALRSIPGAPLVPINLPPGCGFRFRCARAVERCGRETPLPRIDRRGHAFACHVVAAEEGEG